MAADQPSAQSSSQITVWTCPSCGANGACQGCANCGAEAIPGQWVSADDHQKAVNALREAHDLLAEDGVDAAFMTLDEALKRLDGGA